MAQQGQVTKIYKLSTTGFDSLHSQFQTLSKDLERIKKLILDLQGQKISLSGKELETVNKTIVEAGEVQGILEKKIEAVNQASQVSVGRYAELNRAYQLARKSALDMATAYGVESTEAKEAAATAAVYKAQLVEINNLVKTAQTGKVISIAPTSAPAEVPFTNNLAALEAERQAVIEDRDALSTLDKEQIETSVSAKEFGDASFVAAEKVKAAQVDITQMATKYQEYTGSLAQNIAVQTENSAAIAANRAQQKQIELAIKEAGSATQQQTANLINLRQEEQLLVETNKALAITIRNQAKELIAESGSLDEAQAQLNQLQQAYQQLSDVEKAAPFGAAMKAEIDQLEPKVKSLEYELGIFGRNVGNYPQIFGNAFKVLDTEITAVQGKLVSGNFGGAQLSELTARELALKNMTATLGAEFSSTTAKATAYKEVARQLGQTFGTDSKIYKDFSAQVALTNVELKKQDQQLNATGNTGKSVFKSLYGGLRQLANAIPGYGISGLLLLLISPLTALASKLSEIGSTSKGAAKNVESFKTQIRETRNIMKESESEYVRAVTNVETLRINIDLAKQGFVDKNKVLNEYNDTIGKTTGKVSTLDAAEKELVKNGPAYIQMTLLKAASQLALEAAAKKAFESELQYEKDIETARASNDKKDAERDKAAGTAGLSSFTEKGLLNEAQATKNAADRRVKTLNGIAEKFQTDAATIAKKFNFDLFGGKEDKKPKPSQISVGLQEEFKKIDEIRATAIAQENTRTNQIEQVRRLSFDEEAAHLKAVEKINVESLNSKIKILESRKKLNNEEKKTLAEFYEEKSKIELDASKKINDIEKQRFDDTVKGLDVQLRDELLGIEQNNTAIQQATNKTDLEKAQAQLDADNLALEARRRALNKILQLNDAYNAQVIQKAKEEIQKVNDVIAADNKKIVETIINDSDSAIEISRSKASQAVSQQILDLLQSKKSALEIAREIERIKVKSAQDILRQEIGLIKAEIALYELGKKGKLKSEKEYEDAKAKLLEEQGAFAIETGNQQLTIAQKFANALKDLGKGFLENVIGIKKYTKDAAGEAQKLKDAETQALGSIKQAITEAYNNFFENQKAQVDREKEANLERLDMQEQQVLSTAQSEDEKATIQHQFDLRRKDEEKKAGDEKKKIALKQLTIDYALAVLKSLGQYGLPFALIPIAAETALYAIQRANVSKQQFAFGGKAGEVPTRGGEFGGRPHSQGGTDFSFKGRSFNAEAKELAVIRTRNTPKTGKYNLSGTQMEIASALNVIGGGINFKPGAREIHFATGGYLGDSLQAPVYIPSNNNAGNSVSRAELNELLQAIRQDAQENGRKADEINSRIDRYEVKISQHAITEAQNKYTKEANVGKLGKSK